MQKKKKEKKRTSRAKIDSLLYMPCARVRGTGLRE